MRRREFISLVGSVAAWPRLARAQPAGKVHRVALVITTSPVAEMAGPEPNDPAIRAFVHALRAHGYVEGENLILERRSAEGHSERYPEIIRELVSIKVDVIVTITSPMAQQAKAVTTTVPIVMALSTNPVEEGIVNSLAHPGGNVTGLTYNIGPEMDAKRLELLKETLPGRTRVAYLGTNEDWEAPWGMTVRAAAKVLGLTLTLAKHTPTDYKDAFTQLRRDRPDAIFVSPNAFQLANRKLIVDFGTENRLLAMHAFREAVELGALMSYGVSVPDLFRRAAIYVDKILKGATPMDLPIEQPTKFELTINLKTAKVLGLAIPPSVLARADEVIE